MPTCGKAYISFKNEVDSAIRESDYSREELNEEIVQGLVKNYVYLHKEPTVEEREFIETEIEYGEGCITPVQVYDSLTSDQKNYYDSLDRFGASSTRAADRYFDSCRRTVDKFV